MKAIVRSQFYLDITEEAAWQWYEAVWQTLEFIRKQPEIGRLRKDLKKPGIRSWRVEHFTRWLIFYEVRPGEIVFYRVRLGLMNLFVLQVES